MKSRTGPLATLATLTAAALLASLGPAGTARAEGVRRLPLEIGGDAGSCRAVDEDGRAQARAARGRSREAMARLQAQLRQELQAEGGEAIVLNGRGYNYGRDERPDPLRELEILRREAARQRSR